MGIDDETASAFGGGLTEQAAGGETVEKKTSEAQLRAVAKYDAANTRKYQLKLNKKTDADIIERFEKQTSIQGYVKRLVREDIKAHE